MNYRIRAEERTATLGEWELLVGRSAYCSLTIEHSSVSRVHAAFRCIDGEVQVEDLGSRNGTFVAGVRLTVPTFLKVGDTVRIGDIVVTLLPASDRYAHCTTAPSQNPGESSSLRFLNSDSTGSDIGYPCRKQSAS